MNRRIVFAYPGDLALSTGGYAYDRRVIAGLRDRHWYVQPLPLGEGFPAPTQEVKRQAERLLSQLPDGALVVVDALAFGVLDAWAEREARRLRIVALVHHPLALETGLDQQQRQHFAQCERRSLSFARHVIVTSPMTAGQLVALYGVQSERITVAISGTDPGPMAACDGDPVHIVSIGTLTLRKGHDVLVAALKQIEHLAWRATIAGSHRLDVQTANAVARQIDTLGLAGRVALPGECEDARALLADADVFALASRFEGYGMVFAEALSQGLPIVACRAGAVPEVVPDSAGSLVPVDDIDAFAQALHGLVYDKDLRRKKALAARHVGAQLPGWNVTADIIADRLETLQ